MDWSDWPDLRAAYRTRVVAVVFCFLAGLILATPTLGLSVYASKWLTSLSDGQSRTAIAFFGFAIGTIPLGTISAVILGVANFQSWRRILQASAVIVLAFSAAATLALGQSLFPISDKFLEWSVRSAIAGGLAACAMYFAVWGRRHLTFGLLATILAGTITAGCAPWLAFNVVGPFSIFLLPALWLGLVTYFCLKPLPQKPIDGL